MQKNLGLMTGALTTLVFLGVGAALLVDGARWAIILVALGLLRGAFVFKEWTSGSA